MKTITVNDQCDKISFLHERTGFNSNQDSTPKIPPLYVQSLSYTHHLNFLMFHTYLNALAPIYTTVL